MTEPPEAASNIDGRTSIHEHADEIEKSRPYRPGTGNSRPGTGNSRPGTGKSNRGSAGSQHSSLGPVRTARDPVRSASSMSSQSGEMQKRDPLPPIGRDSAGSGSEGEYNSGQNSPDSGNSAAHGMYKVNGFQSLAPFQLY